MTFLATQLEAMVSWCANADVLTAERKAARSLFFADDDPTPVKYWPGVGDQISKERRFLGWFMFDHRPPGGDFPGLMAANALFDGRELDEALRALAGVRYILGIVTGVVRNRRVFMELEDDRFVVDSKPLGSFVQRDTALVTYLLPSRPRLWIPGPGWFEWPVRIGPNMRATLKQVQPDPLSTERLLQSRTESNERPVPEHPKDESLEDAVARMSNAARADGEPALVMTPEEWSRLVQPLIVNKNASDFAQAVIERVGAVGDIEDMNRWLGLAMNIWNNTPQRDRGGKSARELMEDSPGESRFTVDSSDM